MHDTHIKNVIYFVIRRVRYLVNGIIDLIFPLDVLDKEIADLTPEKLSSKMRVKNHGEFSTSLFQYRDPLIKRMVWLLKYKNNQHVVEMFGTIVGEYLMDTIADTSLYEDFANPLIVPVPLTSKRKRERGFNQVERIVQYIAQKYIWIITVNKKALTKIRETAPQTSLKRKERLLNLKDSFSADKDTFLKKNVILLDDITTTGSTLEEVRKELLRAGARKVICITIAH